jgi:hypothetical protein
MPTIKENITAAVVALNTAKRTHGQDSKEANEARLVLTNLIKQAREATEN